MTPRPWKVLKSQSFTFIECKQTRFAVEEQDAKALAALLTRKDREIARLKHQIHEMRGTLP